MPSQIRFVEVYFCAHCFKYPPISLPVTAPFSQMNAIPYTPPFMAESDSNFEMNYHQPAKVKRVTAPLNEVVRALLCRGDSQITAEPPVYGTSGSDHGIESECDTLTDLSFLEEEETGMDCAHLDGSESPPESSVSQDMNLSVSEGRLFQRLEDLLLSSNKLEESILGNITKGLGMVAGQKQREKNHLRRFVMSTLRSAGFNAAVCKTRWQLSNGHPPGDYEFIDVVVEAEGERVLVDIDFRGQFEIARPTAEYEALVEALPILWVGSVDKVRDVIKIMCDAAKRSLKCKGMHLPPWRKYRYAHAKWLGPYKRTTNSVPSSSDLAACGGAFPSHRELHFEMAAARTVRENEQESIANYTWQYCPGVVVPRRKQAPRTPGLTTALALALAAA